MAGSFRSPRKVARRLRILPLARRELRSWPRFMAGYALGIVPRRPYVFRSGARLRIARGVEHVPIIEVFLRREYGEVAPGATVLDLGASTGVFSVYAAAAARIVAYEPMPASFALLRENLRLNRAEGRVEAHNAAVAGASGEQQLYVQGDGLFFPSLLEPDDGAVAVTVPAVTLAEIVERHGLERVDLLKLDIEGAEYDVLYGAPAPVLARIAEIRMEAHDLDGDRRNVAALKRFLAGAGFRITHEQRDPGGTVSLWAAH